MEGNEYTMMAGSKELGLLLYQGKVVHNIYNDSKVQVFYTEDHNAVYKKDEDKVYHMSIDSWTCMVLKMETLRDHYEHKARIRATDC